MEVRNPATLEVIAKLDAPDSAAIKTSVSDSDTAFDAWRNVPWVKRQINLEKIAASIEAEKERLAILLTTEQGKPLHESKREIAAFSEVFRYYAKQNNNYEIIRDDDARIIATREPIGVCVLVLPWNYPVGILGWKLAPCLLGGNTAIVKPSPFAPLTVLEIIKIASQHFPKNVIQSLPGNDDTGRGLVSNQGVQKISFTGSREAGQEILEIASKNFTRTTLEMGGNDAAIILSDCDLGKRFESIFWGCFYNAGQICVAVKRLYVHESLAPELTRRFKEKTESLIVGNGLDAGVQMGPINNERQLRRIEVLVNDAVERGATLVCGGSRYTDHRKTGYFYKPTVMTDIEDDFNLVKEEQFGPAIPILTYRDVDDAIARANATDYGLGDSAWTENVEKGLKIANGLECGTAWVNAHMLVEHSAPFGGIKKSGLGRELGRPGLEEYVQYKTTYLRK